MSPFSPAQPGRAETRLSPCIVLASFRPSYPLYASGLCSLRPYKTAILTILQAILLSSSMCRPLSFHCPVLIFPQPLSRHSASRLLGPGRNRTAFQRLLLRFGRSKGHDRGETHHEEKNDGNPRNPPSRIG